MINPSVSYPTRTAAPTPAMPFGSARDAVSANDPSATPFTALLLNDIWGLMQALASAGGVTPNGNAEAVGASQLLTLLQSGGGALAGAVVATSPVMLAPAQVGRSVLLASGASTVSLPAATSTNPGDTFRLCAQARSTLSVAGGAGMQAGAALVTSLVMPAGTEAIAVSTGSVWWVFGTGVNAAAYGNYRELKLSADGASPSIVISADRLLLDAVTGGGALQVQNVSVTASLSGSGLNGIDSGSAAPNTWYSVWVISDGVTTGSLLSLSATSPTMPSGYTHRRRVGWARTDATANKYPLAFTQADSRVAYKVGTNVPAPRVCAAGSTGSLTAWVPASLAGFVPTTAVTVNATLGGAFNNTSAVAAPNNAYPSSVSGNPTSSPPLLLSMVPTAGVNAKASTADIVLESMSLYWASTSPSGHLQINGWEDSL